MVTWNLVRHITTGPAYCEGECLSSDQKPTDVANGSKLSELDTCFKYIYDAEGETWRRWIEGGNVTLSGDFTATDDGAGNVTITGLSNGGD